MKSQAKPFEVVYSLLAGYEEEEVTAALSSVASSLSRSATVQQLANACVLEIEAARLAGMQEMLQTAQAQGRALGTYSREVHRQFVDTWQQAAAQARVAEEEMAKKKAEREERERAERLAKRTERLKRQAAPTQARARALAARMGAMA